MHLKFYATEAAKELSTTSLVLGGNQKEGVEELEGKTGS
jgi:hypothetical protein